MLEVISGKEEGVYEGYYAVETGTNRAVSARRREVSGNRGISPAGHSYIDYILINSKYL